MADKSSILEVVTIAWLAKHDCVIEFVIAFLTRITWVTLGFISANSGEERD
jgi:hypothetical protein